MWTSGNIIPLPNINPPMRVDKDLRPISLTPVLSKSMEWYAKEWIMDIIDDMLDPHQYGLRIGCSTTLALAELVHGAVKSHGTCVRILLLDFRKAIDRVNYKIIRTQLANTGVTDFLLKWVTSFSSWKRNIKMESP